MVPPLPVITSSLPSFIFHLRFCRGTASLGSGRTLTGRNETNPELLESNNIGRFPTVSAIKSTQV